MKEEWKPIPGYPGYEVSDLGNVRSFWAKRRHKLEQEPHAISTRLVQGGMMASVGRKKGNNINVRVARLIALAFLGPPPKGANVYHLDGDNMNDKKENLYYNTPSDWMKENWSEFSPTRLTEGEVIRIRERRADGFCMQKLADLYGVSQPAISHICTGIAYSEIDGPVHKARAYRIACEGEKEEEQ